VLRPDAVVRDDAGPIHALVTSALFAGTQVALTAQPDGAPALSLFVAARDAPAVGARIGLAFDADALLVYPTD
jgi:hypothetical protein